MSELASFCGVTPQAVKQWVDANGTSPRGKRLKKIADFFQISEIELVYGVESEPKESTLLNVQEKITPYKNSELDKLDYPSKANPTRFAHSAAPYYAEIEEVIRLMEQTDDRGRIKALLAVEDALAVHAAVTLRANLAATLGQPIDDALVKIIQNYNQATSDGKMLILNATTAASKEEERARQLKAG